MKISYKKASQKDIPEIIKIAEKTWFETYYPIQPKDKVDFLFEQMYSAESLQKQMLEFQAFILQMLDNQVVGYASYSLIDEKKATFKLNKLYILPEKQGLKLGIKLLENIENRVKKIGGKHLDLNVYRGNNARFFYEKLGFKIIEEVDIPFGNYFFNDYVMRKNLS